MSDRLRLLIFGSGANTIVRGRVTPFLADADVLWITTEPLPTGFAERFPRLRVEQLPRPLLRRLPARLRVHTADYLAEVALLIARFRPHVIHVHYVSQLDALALAAVRRTPIVLTVMGGDVLSDQIPRPPLIDRFVRRLFRRAAAVCAKSTFLRERCLELGAPAERLHLIRWGVDTSRFVPADRERARAALGLPDAVPLLLSSRALQPLYNHRPLVDAVPQLAEAQRPMLVFSRNAADPAYARALEVHAQRLGVETRFLDPLPTDGMPRLYAACDACASIPSSDGLPQTLLEAAACERPTVSLDLPAYHELPFDGDVLCRVAQAGGVPDPDALRAGLEDVLTRRERPGLKAARAWVQRNAEFDRSVEAMRTLYADLRAGP